MSEPRTFNELFDPEPAHLCLYETNGQYTIVDISQPTYPRMILPTDRHIAAAWALAFKAENPDTRLDRASFTHVDTDSRRVPPPPPATVNVGLPETRRGNVFPIRRRPLEPLDETA